MTKDKTNIMDSQLSRSLNHSTMKPNRVNWSSKIDLSEHIEQDNKINCSLKSNHCTFSPKNGIVHDIQSENNNDSGLLCQNIEPTNRFKLVRDKSIEVGNQYDEAVSEFSSSNCNNLVTEDDRKSESMYSEEEVSQVVSMYRKSQDCERFQTSSSDLITLPEAKTEQLGNSSNEKLTTSKVFTVSRKRIKSRVARQQDDIECSCDGGAGSCNGQKLDRKDANLKSGSSKGQNLSESLTRFGIRNRSIIQMQTLVSLGENRRICNKHMPWFGIDVGGSLVKVVFFDPKDASREETMTLRRIRRYLKSSKAYGTTGKRDAHLEMPNCVINKHTGTLHFIRFATNQMPEFLHMAKSKGFADTINTVCATGGGAYKFEQDIKTNLGISLHKTDELDSIIHGIHYIDKYNSLRECYFLEEPLDDTKCIKVPYDFSRPYPYLVVNIGSGVSILAVYSSTSYSRISGSSIGGGTFLGLCCLLTQCKTFDEAICLAKAGSSSKIDKLVKDIYGGDYPKFNLSGDTVASSFGHMNIEEKRKDVKREDLARALLEMVTINIGSIARMCAMNEDIDRVVFIGNFLRVNQLSMKLLSYAVNYWSKGAMKALFLEHEGYFGAVGCFVESTQGCLS